MVSDGGSSPQGGEAGSLWNLHTLFWSRKDLVYWGYFFFSFLKYYFGFFCLFIFWLCHTAFGISVPQMEIEPGLGCEIAKA